MHSIYNNARHHKRPLPSQDRVELSTPKSIPQSAYIKAYEAQLVYGQNDKAEELYSKGGRGLMRWQGDGEEVWADRHDIIHLLTDLPSSSRARRRTPSPISSPTSSWASLPSDLEETFTLSDPEEIAEYERTKRLRQIAGLREARLREREEQDLELERTQSLNGKGKGKAWPEEEIPPHPILTLMSHTAASLLKSPNPKVLESRILMNHASDERFEFLRGRWKLTWERTKKDAKAKHDQASGKSEKEKKSVGSLIGGYESSDEDEEEGESEREESEVSPPDVAPPPPPPEDEEPPLLVNESHTTQSDGLSENDVRDGDAIAEEERKRARRLKAEEWKKKRAQAKS